VGGIGMNKERHMGKVYLRSTIFFCVVLICCTALSFAEKTDVVVLKKGIRIIGEIKMMDKGRLSYSTDDMSTVSIDWTKILRISSKYTFDIMLKKGKRYHGSLEDSGQDGKVVIVTQVDRITEDIQSIVGIAPLKTGFWQRFRGKLSVGFNFQKANNHQKFTSSTDISYYGPRWELQLQSNNYISVQEDTDKISRNSAVLSFERFLPKYWSYLGFGRVQQNDELNLDLRALFGVGAGRFFVKSNFIELGGIAAVLVTTEKYAGSDGSNQNVEAGFILEFHAFRYHGRDLDLSADLRVFPNLTDWGRVRIEFKTSVDYEIFNDFYLTLSFFDQFDSRPPSDLDVAKNDLGLDLSLTWKFN
jgi:hypothetical protein